MDKIQEALKFLSVASISDVLLLALNLAIISVTFIGMFVSFRRALESKRRTSTFEAYKKDLQKLQREKSELLPFKLQKSLPENNNSEEFFDRGFLEDFLLQSEPSIQYRETAKTDILAASRERLLAESERLKSRSISNLTLGLIFMVGAAFAAILTLFYTDAIYTDLMSVLIGYAPRFVIVVLLQFTSSYFLKLHVANESDLKQNKNELTNMELRTAARDLARESGKNSEIAMIFAKEERNFVLSKDQKTAGHHDEVLIKDLIDAISKLGGKREA